MVQTVRFNSQLHRFPDEATPEMIAEALGVKPPSSNDENKNLSHRQELINKVNYITGINRTPIDIIRDLAEGATSGLVKGGEFLNEQMMKIPGAQSLASSIHNKFFPNMNVSNEDVNSMVSKIGSPNKSIGGEITKGVGSYLPYGIAGGPSLIGQLVGGGLYGAAETKPEENNLFGLLPQGRTGGAIESALINALTHGTGKTINALRPSKLLRGNLSPKELQANVEAAQGTPTGLGEVISSPFLKRQHENVLTKLPFSGANDKFEQAGKAVEKSGKNVLKDLLGNNNPENVTDQLSVALTKKFKIHQKNKSNLYKAVNKQADKEGLKLDLPSFSKKAKDYNDALNETSILKHEPDSRFLLNKLVNYKNPVKVTSKEGQIIDASGKPIINQTIKKFPTLKEANLLKGKLNYYAENFRSSPDPIQRSLADVFGNLAGALKDDINQSIKKSGNRSLADSYKIAEENYAKNYSPFLDKEIYKFISGRADPDTLSQSFLKVSRGADRSKVLSKLTKKLSDKEQSLLAYSYFSRALDNEGNFNPAKLSTLISNLGKNQLKILIPNPQMRKQLSNYNRLYKMNVKGVNIMQNPATGQQNLDIIPALLSHASTTLVGGQLGGLPGALLGLVMPGLIAKPLVNALTSPSIREALVNEMIKNKPLNKNIIPALQAGMQGTINR